MANTKLCEIDGCGKRHLARGYCSNHYRRFRSFGNPVLTLHRRFCTIEGCEKKHLARGFCSLHYQRALHNGDPLALHSKFYNGADCEAQNCARPAKKGGLCGLHYQQKTRLGEAGEIKRQHAPMFPDRPISAHCAARGCDLPVYCRGVCHAHYHRFQRHGQNFDESAIKVKLDEPRRHINKSGYVYFSQRGHPEAAKNGNVLEHRAVLAQILGRALLPGENAHHRNGNRSDNRPENIELWVTLQPSGQRPEDLLTYAQEIIARYGSEAA